MKIPFDKYHGNGNDFVLIDNRELKLTLSDRQIIQICDRRFGVGSDGLILIEETDNADYFMNFYNPDASQSFCGNGSRCSLHFCEKLGIIKEDAAFLAIDGTHKGSVKGTRTKIQLADVLSIKKYDDGYFVNTGSPHMVVVVDDLDKVDVLVEGKRLRYDPRFQPGGTNVNFVEITENGIRSRVYERGVENETFSSGSGTTAQAICTYKHLSNLTTPIQVETKGGILIVDFKDKGGDHFTDIWLKGPVNHVFSGIIDL